MTAIQELLKELETFKGMCSTDGENFIIDYAISNTKSKIRKEKEQLIGFAKFYILKHAIPYELDVLAGKITDEQKIEMLSNDTDYSWDQITQEYIENISDKK